MILDHIPVGAGIDRRDSRLDGRHTGDQQKKTVRRDFLGQLQQIDAAFPGHAHIGNHDVEDLRFELALRSLDVVCHLDAIPFLAESDLQQFADGAFVVHHEDVRHFLAVIFRCCFSCLHNPSSHSRDFHDEFRAAVFL